MPEVALPTSRPLRFALILSAAGITLLLVVSQRLSPSASDAFAQVFAPYIIATAIGGQLLTLMLCGAALWVLIPSTTLTAALLTRWVRDAMGALPIGLPGLSEAAGIRMLGLFGLRPREALAATVADVVAETVAQAAYALCARVLAPLSLRAFPHLRPAALGAAAVMVGALGGLMMLALRLAPAAWRASLRAAVATTLQRLRSKGAALSVVLHTLAWVAGGLQLFLLAYLLHTQFSLAQSLSLEGLVFAARAAAFFVPAGLGVQEAALVSVGGAYGLTTPVLMTFALLFRVRDLIGYSPALAVWFSAELRQAFRSAPMLVIDLRG